MHIYSNSEVVGHSSDNDIRYLEVNIGFKRGDNEAQKKGMMP